MNKVLDDDAGIKLQDRQVAYMKVFGDKNNRAIETVLADLAQFCRANEGTFNVDQRFSDVLNGRREVWLRIVEQLHLTLPELYSKYK